MRFSFFEIEVVTRQGPVDKAAKSPHELLLLEDYLK